MNHKKLISPVTGAKDGMKAEVRPLTTPIKIQFPAPISLELKYCGTILLEGDDEDSVGKFEVSLG